VILGRSATLHPTALGDTIPKAKRQEINSVRAAATRVPGLPIRNCADISNNLVPRGTKMSAIDVEANAFFERLYLVPGQRKNAPFVTMPSAPTSPPLDLRLFLDFRAIFFPSGHSIFGCQHDSPSNLAESRSLS